MIPLRRKTNPYMLVLGMTGVKLGDRIAQIGCAHGGRLAAVAGKVGLSGRAVAIVPDTESAVRARKGAEQEGVLVEIEVAPPTRLPVEDAAFDLAIVDDTEGLLAAMDANDQAATVRESARILRPGGRVMVLGALPPTGIGALFARTPRAPVFDPQPVLASNGFKFVRHLAEREGLQFVEGLKARE